MTQPKPSDETFRLREPIKVDSSFARAVGRFAGAEDIGYVATTAPFAWIRSTRAEAEADELAWRERER